MTTIADVILTPEMPISTPLRGIDFDPLVGMGFTPDEMDAPEGFDSSAFTFDPFVGA